jgi:hypothetical protein
MVHAMTKAIMTRKAIELTGAITAGIGLWCFTSGRWLSGVVFVAAVGALVAWYIWTQRRVRSGRRY